MGVQHLLAQQATGAGWLGFAPLIFIFAIFYFLLIMPQQRRQKKWQKMLSELKTGDKVVTSGGIRGTIIAIKDDYLHLRVDRKSTRLNSSHSQISYAVFCLKKKTYYMAERSILRSYEGVHASA